MFNGLTNIGKEYIAKCLAENKPITFTKVKIGDGLLDLDENAELLTDVKSLKKEVEILDKTQEGELTTLTILLDNSDIEVGYYPREIGIYVTDEGVEKLYWYINDGLETQWLCAANKYPIKFKQIINLMTTNLESVIVNWSGKDLFVDREFVEEKIKEKVRTFEIQTIAELQSRKNLKVGDIVEVLGYYTTGDGAGHKRIIANEDDGSGVQLNNKLWANIVHNGEVNVSWFGAKGDGINESSSYFEKAQNSTAFEIIVPRGIYLLNNFEFKNAKTWRFLHNVENKQQWFSDENSYIKTETGLIVSAGVRFTNIIIKYGGNELPQNRPSGIKFKGSYWEINGLHVQGFYVGLDFGKNAGGGSYYGRLYNFYLWYNYFAGVRIDGGDNSQVNFLSFFDGNVGSNGVDSHNKDKKPDITRGYGFYFSTCSSVYINNIDVSSNETCGIYIDNSSTIKQVRGLTINNIYAEGNKFCNIYYKNGIDSSATRTSDVHMDCGFFNNNGCSFFVGTVFTENDYIPPNVTFFNRKSRFENCFSNTLENKKHNIKSPMTIENFTFFGIPNHNYEIILEIKPKSTGNLVLQNVLCKAYFDPERYFSNENRETTLQPNTINFDNLENKKLKIYYKFPNSDSEMLMLNLATYGLEAEVINGYINDITYFEETSSFGVAPNGYIKIENNIAYMMINGQWQVLISNISQLNNLYYGEKMKQEGVYNDFIAYMDEKTAYDKQQEKLEQERQLAYEQALKENPNLSYEEFMSVQPMTLNLIEEPQPSKALQTFMEKYL